MGIFHQFCHQAIRPAWEILLLDDGKTDFSIERRLKTASVRSFTREKLHYKKGSYPYIACKGADTVIFLNWLQFYIKLVMPQNVGGPLAATLDMMLLGVQAGLAFTKDIHRHGLFMQKRCQFKLWKACSSFLRAYAVLAEKSLQDGQSLFG